MRDDRGLADLLFRILMGRASQFPPPPPTYRSPWQLPPPPTPSRRVSPLASIYRAAQGRTKATFRQQFRVVDARQIPDTESLPHANVGKEVETAVLYVDMRASTELHTHEHRVTVARILKSYLSEMVQVARYYRSYIRGFAGDRVMIVPDQGPMAATRAVDIAVSMRDVILRALNPVFSLTVRRTIAVGVGIDYGPMLATKVGMKRNPEHTDLIWVGPPANIASKITDTAKPNEILVSATVYPLLDPRRYPTHLWTPRQVTITGTATWVYSLRGDFSFEDALREARL